MPEVSTCAAPSVAPWSWSSVVGTWTSWSAPPGPVSADSAPVRVLTTVPMSRWSTRSLILAVGTRWSSLEEVGEVREHAGGAAQALLQRVGGGLHRGQQVAHLGDVGGDRREVQHVQPQVRLQV